MVSKEQLVKEVPIERAIAFLGLQMTEASVKAKRSETVYRQFRGPCPVCNPVNDRALTVTPPYNNFKCWDSKVTGNVVDLVQHIKSCDEAEAITFIREQTEKKDFPMPKGEAKFAKKGIPLPVCKRTGINYAKETPELEVMLWDRLVKVPLRDEKGILIGEIFINTAWLPLTWNLP